MLDGRRNGWRRVLVAVLGALALVALAPALAGAAGTHQPGFGDPLLADDMESLSSLWQIPSPEGVGAGCPADGNTYGWGYYQPGGQTTVLGDSETTNGASDFYNGNNCLLWLWNDTQFTLSSPYCRVFLRARRDLAGNDHFVVGLFFGARPDMAPGSRSPDKQWLAADNTNTAFRQESVLLAPTTSPARLYFFTHGLGATTGRGVDIDDVEVRCDTVAPVNPTALASTTHTVGGTVKAGDPIGFAWSGADDGSPLASQVGGYSHVLDQAAGTVPPATITSAQTSFTSGALPAGEWYFHLRTVDNAGNWAPTALHLGPFKVVSPTVCAGGSVVYGAPCPPVVDCPNGARVEGSLDNCPAYLAFRGPARTTNRWVANVFRGSTTVTLAGTAAAREVALTLRGPGLGSPVAIGCRSTVTTATCSGAQFVIPVTGAEIRVGLPGRARPGRFTLTATSAAPAANTRFRVQPPAYGLVDRLWFSRRKLGTSETLMPGHPKELFVNWRWTARPKQVVRWQLSLPGGGAQVGVLPTGKRWYGWGDGRGFRGRYTVTIKAGGRLVDGRGNNDRIVGGTVLARATVFCN